MMKKPLLRMAILLLLVVAVLSMTTPLRNSSYTFLSSVSDSLYEKPLIMNSGNTNSGFIDSLANYTFVAHRGAPSASKEPENSLPAYKASARLGFKIVETDLQLTKDGQWVLMHDYSLDRTTTGEGSVKSKSLKAIKELRLKDSGSELLTIPTLEEFLKLCSSEGLIPILDIKPTENEISSKNYNSLFRSLNKYNLLDKSILTTKSKKVLKELRTRNNSIAIAAMLEVTPENLEFVKELGSAFIYTNHDKLTDEKIELMRNNNTSFGVWTINNEKVSKHFLEKGALMVVTDNLLTK
jgi:glycerophosphoryl diester phosphodiesterase